MKPVILITLHRRYEDLVRSLDTINERAHEFSEPPAIGIVWADPELDREWWVDELFTKYDKLEFVLMRPKLEFEGERGGTTYPESHNITYGLRLVKELYGDNAYGIVQATDSYPKRNTYGEIDGLMRTEHNAVLYYWHHNCLNAPGFCTYYFAVKLEEKFWPPICDLNLAHDALEWTWAKIAYGSVVILGKEMYGYAIFPPNRRWNNNNLTLGELKIPYRNKDDVGMFISGKKDTWFIILYNKVKDWVKKLRHY